jgi:RNA polymerase sigma-70 factor (ECF subfamily)
MRDESVLVQRVLDGDEEAFTEILRLHQARIRAYLGRYTRNNDVVDDLAQDVFLRAYKSLDTYRFDSRLSTWLIGIAKHIALTYLRGEARRQQRLARKFQAAFAEWRAELAGADIGTDAETDGEMSALMECIKELPERSAELVRRHYFQGDSIKSISKSIGKKGGTLRMTLLRIREALRSCIELRVSEQGA